MCVTYLTNGKYISYLNSIKKSNINESTGNLQEKKNKDMKHLFTIGIE